MEAKGDRQNDFIEKRQQYTIGIRRQRREQILSKRRNQGQNNQDASEQNSKISYIVDSRYADYIVKFQNSRFDFEMLSQLQKSIHSSDIMQQHYGIIGIRKIMSLAQDPPIQAIIDMGLIPRLIQFVNQQQYPQLQLQAAWALTNVASGSPEQCNSIINKDAIPMFIKLVKSPHPGIVQQSIWALGNIASDSSFNRDTIIRNGGIPNLIYSISNAKTMQLIQPGAWTLSNLCRGTPLPNYELVKEGVIYVAEILAKYDLKEDSSFADCCWSISYNFPKKQQQYKRIVSRQLISKLKQRLKSEDFSITVPIIRVLGHITKISTQYVDLVLENSDMIGLFENLLNFSKKIVRLETCWIISNIASGPQRHINKLLQNQTLIAKLLTLFQSDTDEIKRQICYLFFNMTSEGNPEIVYRFFQSVNIIKFYAQALTSQQPKLVQNSLFTMYSILELGQKFKENGQNKFVLDLVNLGCLGLLEDLQLHESQQIYEGVVKIMKQFFEMQDSIV